MHGTAEHVEQWNARKKKISVDFMKNRVHIAQKNENEIVKMLKMTKKYWNIVDIRRTAYYDTDMEHNTKCRNGNDANVERKAVGKAFREIRREL